MNTYPITRAINRIRVWGISIISIALLIAHMIFDIPHFGWVIGGAMLIIYSLCEAIAIVASAITGRYVRPYER